MDYTYFDINTMPEVHLLGQTICGRDWKLVTRTIQDYEFIIVYQGKAVFFIEDAKYVLVPGDFILISPGEVHSGVTDIKDPVRFYYAHFAVEGESGRISEEGIRNQVGEFMARVDQKDRTNLYFVLPQSRFKRAYLPSHMPLGKYQNEAYTLFEKALAERNHLTLSSEAMISLYISQIFYLVTRCVFDGVQLDTLVSKEGEMPRILQQAIFYICEHYNEPLEIKVLCDRLMVTPQYLIRLFKKRIGTTPLQYIHQLRIERAKDLIRGTSMAMKEIACAVGIDNPYYFSRLFKKMEGISPSEYKKGLDSQSNG